MSRTSDLQMALCKLLVDAPELPSINKKKIQLTIIYNCKFVKYLILIILI